MFKRSITKSDVVSSLETGEIIDEYKDEKPFPCYFHLNFINRLPLHVVVALDIENDKCIIVTAYIPGTAIWENDFKTRRKSQ